jgi:spore germination cell wall hydrolase CwlJ-like protein
MGMGESRYRRSGPRTVRLLPLAFLLLLAACAQPRSLPTAPAGGADETVARQDEAGDQLAALPKVEPMPPYKATPAERKCLAQAVYFESRAESIRGQQAVAAVVLNRVRSDRFPDDICAVVRQGNGKRHQCQFSWFCDGRSDKPRDMSAWATALEVADAALNGAIDDPTHGALFFHATHVKPRWRKKLTQTAAIDNHVFYR